MENYLNQIAKELAGQIKLRKTEAIAHIQIVQTVDKQIPGFIASNAYTQFIWIPSENNPSSVIIIESQLSYKDEGGFLAVSCIDVLASWLREAVCEEPNLQCSNFRFVSLDGSLLNAEAAAAQIRARSSIIITQHLSSWMGVNFRAIDELALRPYEGQKPGGIIAVSFSKKTETVCDWKPEEYIPFDTIHTRLIRKLLAGTKKNGGLVLYKNPNDNTAHIIGVCNSLADMVKKRTDIFPIWFRISNWLNWELHIYQQTVFQSQISGYSAVSEPDVLTSIQEEFGSSRDYSNLLKAIRKIQRQTHGAAAVILDLEHSPKVAAHMEELAKSKKSMKISFSTAGEAITHAAGMDGAVILDLNGNIQYLATILDGPSCISGDLSRGSRFNSVQNFCAWISLYFEKGAVGIVCSEDGGMDVIVGKQVPDSV